MVSHVTVGSRSLQDLAEMQDSMSGTLDRNGSSGLGVGDFSAMIASASSGAPQTGDALSSFASFDANGDGSLSQAEFDAGLQSLADAPQSTVARFGDGAPPGLAPPGDGGSADDQALQKLSQTLGQMARTFAAINGQQASGFSVTA